MWEPRHLAALDAVAREGTFGRAAAALGYTQSSLSQQIAGLERAVGGRLFERRPGARPPELTPLGRVVLAEARAILARQAQGLDAVDCYHGGGGRIDVGTFQTVTNEILPAVIAQVRVEHPEAQIRLSEEEAEAPRLDALDLLFFDGPPPAGAHGAEVVRDPHVLIAAAGSWPAGSWPTEPSPPSRRSRPSRRTASPARPVRLADLHGRPMVALPRICDQARVEASLAAAGVVPDVVFRTADNQGVTAMVRAGLGLAIMPTLAVRGQLRDPALSFHELTPDLPERVISLYWRESLSPLATRFRDLSLDAGGRAL